MANPRVLIMAAGDSSRWDNHLGIPKHLAPIFGEPLIHRTVRQFSKALGEDNVFVVSTNPDYSKILFIPQPTERTILPHTALGHSVPYWSQSVDTIVVLGDVVFSDPAVRTITQPRQMNDVTFFGRSGESGDGHCRELFAFWIPLTIHQRMKSAMLWAAENRVRLQMPRGGGWLVYARLNNVKLGEDEIKRNFVEINDGFTDDFDYPDQYERWIGKHKAAE